MSLTIDIGNSRIKWAEWQADKIVANGVGAYDQGNLSANLDRLFAAIKKPMDVYAVCVASVDVRNALTEWVKRCWQLDVDYLATAKSFNNVTHGYLDPTEHGPDRWAAIVAANYIYPQTSLCVIGAGTALTIDFLKSDGQHLGGYILPSYVSMHHALTGDTANVNSVHDSMDSESRVFEHFENIPNNTNDAVNFGLHRLLRAGVLSFCKQAESVFGEPAFGQSAQVLITGGFAETILSYPDMPEMHHVPDLVLQGLYKIKTTKP